MRFCASTSPLTLFNSLITVPGGTSQAKHLKCAPNEGAGQKGAVPTASLEVLVLIRI